MPAGSTIHAYIHTYSTLHYLLDNLSRLVEYSDAEDPREGVEIEGQKDHVYHVLALGVQRWQLLQEGRQIGILHAVVPETKT